jgi:hypothetical protein
MMLVRLGLTSRLHVGSCIVSLSIKCRVQHAAAWGTWVDYCWCSRTVHVLCGLCHSHTAATAALLVVLGWQRPSSVASFVMPYGIVFCCVCVCVCVLCHCGYAGRVWHGGCPGCLSSMATTGQRRTGGPTGPATAACGVVFLEPGPVSSLLHFFVVAG